MKTALLVLGVAILAACAQSPCANVGSAASSVSVSSAGAPDGGWLNGSAREGPNLITKKFDEHEIQLFISDASECGGSILPTREIVIDIYAYSLVQGAIPGTYQVGNSLGPPTFATFFTSGLGQLQNSPSGTVTLTRVDSCVSEGRFDISTQFADGGNVTFSGTFLAPFCGVQGDGG
jgi:hypothetical protein